MHIGEAWPGIYGESEPGICACPACGFDYVHLVSCVVNQLGEVTTITSEGPRLTLDTPVGRGTCIEIAFIGECGHQWVCEWHFHKGQVLTATTRIEDCPPAEDGTIEWPATLRRG